MKMKTLLPISILLLVGGVIAYWRISVQRAELRSELKRTIVDAEASIEARVEAAAQLWDLDQEAEAVLAPLTEGLEADFPVSERAAEVFVSMGADAQVASPDLLEAAKNPPAIFVVVHDQEHWRQFTGNASRALFRIGVTPRSRSEFLGALNDCLRDDDRDNDGQFFELLSIIDSDPRSSIPLHVAAIESEDPAGVAWAHEYLIRLDPTDTSSAALLVQRLNNESPAVRKWCIAALIKLGPASSDAFPSVAQALYDENEGVVRLSALWMGMIGRRGRDELQQLEPMDWTEQTQFAINWAIRQNHQEDALSFIGINRLESSTVQEANQNATRDPTDPLLDKLTTSMRTGPVERSAEDLHQCIAAVADKRVHPHVRDTLMKNLGGGSWGNVLGMRMTHLEGIRRHHPEDIRHLTVAGIKCLSDGNQSIRSAACRFLRALGQDANVAIPSLVVQAEYDPTFARKAAEDALYVIEPSLLTQQALERIETRDTAAASEMD